MNIHINKKEKYKIFSKLQQFKLKTRSKPPCSYCPPQSHGLKLLLYEQGHATHTLSANGGLPSHGDSNHSLLYRCKQHDHSWLITHISFTQSSHPHGVIVLRQIKQYPTMTVSASWSQHFWKAERQGFVRSCCRDVLNSMCVAKDKGFTAVRQQQIFVSCHLLTETHALAGFVCKKNITIKSLVIKVCDVPCDDIPWYEITWPDMQY